MKNFIISYLSLFLAEGSEGGVLIKQVSFF
jgi:hypothetical protein